MFDVFYIGKKPGLFAHEREAESIVHAQSLSRTRYFWVVNYLADYTGFDFLWEPVPWESHQRHAWASQWQKDSGTYLVPKLGYTDTNYHRDQITMQADMDLWENIHVVEEFDFSWHPDYSDPPFNYEFGTQWQKTGGPRYPIPHAEHVKYVSQSNSKARARAAAIYLIDHMDGTADQFPQPVEKRSRYFDNYKDTLTRLAKTIPDDQEFVWICSSICDYTNFDFTWHPEAWQNYMLHVFPSDGEKFGDTFFMHVPTFRSKIAEFELLEWYDLNFVSEISVPRRPMPVIRHNCDSQVDAVKKYDWAGPLALFAHNDMNSNRLPVVPLWRTKTKTVIPLSQGAGLAIIPKNAVPEIKQQIYDYEWVDKTRRNWIQDRPLDIVYISNGETNAERNWEWLKEVRQSKMIPNRLVRVDGVNGRAAAYRAALEASNTDWAFCVFAKLQVESTFDWSWQPDRLQSAKHYIFHARNPVNGLEYGHMAMIAYNKRLTLENRAKGLDFTLDQAHEVVPVLSGVAWYADSPWMAWRTAFREALKLKHSLPDVENEYRLNCWLTKGEGRHGAWSTLGAQDAVEYYDEVGGDFAALKKSYEWDWLASYAMLKRNLLPDR